MKNGGPAFPVECSWDGEEPRGVQTGNTVGWHTGMTLRDYFAAKAMQGMLADPDVEGLPSEVAAFAYLVADAMLKARGGEQGPQEDKA